MISPSPYPLVLSLSKDEALADTLPLMVRQAHHERLSTDSIKPLVLSLSKDDERERLA